MAVMKMENESQRTSREVFDEFAPLEKGFVKTLDIDPCERYVPAGRSGGAVPGKAHPPQAG